MRRLTLIILLSLAPPAFAEEGDLSEGLGLIDEGARMLFEELMGQFGPSIEAFRDQIGDLGAYHAPEVLPNGDIIIRRKRPVEEPPLDIPEGGLEL